MDANTKRFLTVYGLSRRLGLPISWLRAEADAGRLPSLRAGRRLMFHAEAVEAELLRRAKRDGERLADADERLDGGES